ncbi:unnamed protein product [Cylicocyclus nassatus]|uniref:Apple domain-containing protein n=1 Tax=Cylicocyclus nassatus TaxID=53992 RepID=A0AA36HEV4_CYLNA|nr:unnamed protein product [Cylicocyclus nassatus]
MVTVILRLLLSVTLIYSTSSSTFTSKCFVYKPNHAVSNSQSISELFRVTIGDCLNYCIMNAAKMGDGCASAVYHKLHSTCQIYGHNGNFNGSVVVPVDDHDFYERTSWAGVCQDKVVPKRGYKQRPRQYAARSERVSNTVDISKYADFVNLQTSEPLTDTTSVTSSTPPYLPHMEEDDSRSSGDASTITFLNPTRSSAKKDCSAETPYIVYPFKQMHKKIITSYPGMNSVVACVAACIDTKDCKAVTYKIGLCILHGASPATDSGLLVDGNEQTMVIENGCQLTASTLPSLLSNKIETHSGQAEQSPWEEWGACQFRGGERMIRVRYRECDNCDNLQAEPC